MTLASDFLAILVCPTCKTALSEHDNTLVCASCACTYPIRDGIPVLLPDAAVKTTAGEDAVTKNT